MLGGGAIKYFRMPVYFDFTNFFWNNFAAYGSNVGGYPIKLKERILNNITEYANLKKILNSGNSRRRILKE